MAASDVTLELERELERELRRLEGKPALPQEPEKEQKQKPEPLPGVGAIVETTGLSNKDHNGLRGKVLRLQKVDLTEIRVVVQLPPPLGEKALRRTNLMTIVEAPSGDGSAMDSDAKRFRAEKDDEEEDWYNVQAPAGWKGVSASEYLPAIKHWDTFDRNTKILVIGDGNFSWSWDMCNKLGSGENMVVTDACVNSTVRETSMEYLLPLIEAGCTITMRLDATRMGRQTLIRRCGQYFDRVVWNFPHTATPVRAAHHNEEHMHLLTVYLQQAQEVLRVGGRASITVKDGYPYSEWGVGKLSPGGRMHYLGCQAFTPDLFTIYNHVTTRQGAGVGGSSKIGRLYPAHTYVYEMR